MWPPVLFRERGLLGKLVVAVVLPIAFGALCGFLLGEPEPWFNVISTAGALGGVSAGFEHVGWRDGFARGVAGGALYSGALVLLHAARGVPVLAELPFSYGASVA